MKFARTPWVKSVDFRWSKHREAAARRAVERERTKVETLKTTEADSMALFPELQRQEIVTLEPRFTDTDQRREQLEHREHRITQEFREARARNWRSARAKFYALPPLRRRGMLLLWHREIYPMDPAYFATLIQIHNKPGCSPWTALRKYQQVALMGKGRLARPARMLDLTRCFHTL